MDKLDNIENQEETVQLPQQSFEEDLARLEIIVSQLNNGKAPLSEGLTLFEEGARLLKQCTKALEEAEQRVNLVMEAGEEGKPVLAPMPLEEK